MKKVCIFAPLLVLFIGLGCGGSKMTQSEFEEFVKTGSAKFYKDINDAIASKDKAKANKINAEFYEKCLEAGKSGLTFKNDDGTEIKASKTYSEEECKDTRDYNKNRIDEI